MPECLSRAPLHFWHGLPRPHRPGGLAGWLATELERVEKKCSRSDGRRWEVTPELCVRAYTLSVMMGGTAALLGGRGGGEGAGGGSVTAVAPERARLPILGHRDAVLQSIRHHTVTILEGVPSPPPWHAPTS